MDKEYAKILKAMIATTNVQNTPEALTKAQQLHQWLDELIAESRVTMIRRELFNNEVGNAA